MIAYDVCYGNRNTNYTSIDKTSECSKILDNQFISLMNTYDYVMASYDSECTSIYSGSCSNYNYIYNNISFSWLMNGVSNNSYQVYYYQGGIIYTNASNSKKYNIVIYLDSNELYVKGDGSISNPYIIKD